MMKRLFTLTLAMLLLACLYLPAAAEAPETFVTDLAGILSAAEVKTLNENAAAVTELYGCGVYIIVVEDMGDHGYRSIEKFGEYVYKEWELGCGPENTGILLVMSMAERDYDLTAYGEDAHRAFTDYGKSALAETFLDNFRRNDWAGGFADYIDYAGSMLARASAGDPLDRPGYSGPEFYYEPTLTERIGKAAVPGLIVGVIFAFIYCSVLKSKMKSARTATEASAYVADRGVNIFIHDDRFSHSTQVRHHIDHDSGSRGGFGGGGGTHISSGGFSHSSGKF